jgi:uncharacterized damage-inducible protein DinB
MTIDRDHALRLFAFHHWAADRLLDALAPVTAGQLDAPWGGSFASGRALLRHVVGAERVWVSRWAGRSLPSIPDFPATHAGADFRREWERVAAEERAFLAALEPGPLDRPLAYTNLKGEPCAYPLADVFVHVVNHGTYHRGQLSHLLRDLGVAPPATDYLIFVETTRGEA